MAQQADGPRRGAQEAGEARRRATQEVAAGAKRAALEAAEGAKQVAEEASDMMRRATEETVEHGRDSALVAAEIYNETAQGTAADLQAIATLSSITAGGLSEMRRAWMDWLGRSLRTTTRATQLMLSVKSIEELADLQRSFVKESFDNFLEGSAQMLRITGRLSEDARRPIEDRFSELRADPEQQQPEREEQRP